MRAAARGIVGDVGVAGAQVVAVSRADVAHGVAHRAEVDGNVRRVRHEAPLRVEHRAAEVEAVADVRAARRLAQDVAHALRDGCDEVTHHLEAHGIALDAAALRGVSECVGDHQHVAGTSRDVESRLDDERSARFEHDERTRQSRRADRGAPEARHVDEPTVEEDPRGRRRVRDRNLADGDVGSA